RRRPEFRKALSANQEVVHQARYLFRLLFLHKMSGFDLLDPNLAEAVVDMVQVFRDDDDVFVAVYIEAGHWPDMTAKGRPALGVVAESAVVIGAGAGGAGNAVHADVLLDRIFRKPALAP